MQKWVCGLLLCFANLAMLPGCQLFHAQNNHGTREDPRGRHELTAAKETVSRQTEQEAKEAKSLPQLETNDRVKPKKDAPLPGPIEPQEPILPTPSAEPLKGPKLDASKKYKPSFLELPGAVQPVALESPRDGVLTAQVLPQQLPLIPLVEQKSAKRALHPVVAALEAILEGRQPDAIRSLEVYDKDTQEFYLRYLPMLTLFANKRIDELTPREIGVLNEQLIGLVDMLRPRSQLTITKMCFCSNIRAYADYVALPDNHAFLAGAKDRLGELVQLYVELKNFACEPTPGADFMTRLVCTLEMHDAKDEKVWSHTYDRNLTTYPRKTRLNDFYSNYRFYVPAIPPGQYRLTIQIADETNPDLRRVVRKSLDFRVTPVVGQPSLR